MTATSWVFGERMTLRTRIFLDFLSVVLCILPVVLIAYWESTNAEMILDRSALEHEILEAEMEQRGHFRTQLLDAYELIFTRAREASRTRWLVGQRLVADGFLGIEQAVRSTDRVLATEGGSRAPEIRLAELAGISSLHQGVEADLGRAVAAASRGDRDEAAALLRTATENYNSLLLPRISLVIELEAREARAQVLELQRRASRLQDRLLYFSLAAILWAVFLAVFVSTFIGRRFREYIDAARAVAAGNLDVQLSERGPEELVQLSRAFNLMTTTLRDAKSTLLRQQEILVQKYKMSALGEMAGGIAHEINTPLASIKLLSSHLQELVTENPPPLPLVQELSGKIEQTTDRVAEIVRSLKSFAREESKDPVREVPLSLVIEDTLTFCRDRIRAAGIGLRIGNMNPGLCVLGRSTEIGQVLLNLLVNAVDAVSGLEERWIRITAEETGDSVEVCVEDSGHPIPPEIRQKMFQAFYTTKDSGKGTGLGLSVSRRILQGYGGALELDPSPRTRFVLRFPKKPAPSEEKPCAEPPTSRS
jgi:C4-dicarboxylate-specific signal transduction histidine kinase